VVICFVGCCITWPVLFPINATGGNNKHQLDLLTFGAFPRFSKEIPTDDFQQQMWATSTSIMVSYLPGLLSMSGSDLPAAHTFVAWIFIAFVFFMVTRESIYYINLRQAYLLSPMYAYRISSRTVLFASVPAEYANEAKMRQMCGSKLKNVWIATETKKLSEHVEERNKVAMKLEAAETKLIKLAHNAHLKATKKGAHPEEGDIQQGDISGESGSAAARWIKPKQRPTHKLKPLIGKKVDTINWCRSELQRMIPEVEREQEMHRSNNAKASSTVIVEFFNQTEAQAAYQMVAHHQPLHMSPRVIGFDPDEIVWSNTGITWRTRVIRNIACIAAVVVTIIFW
jgi:calcium permeable stress-gated cation channel